MADLKNKVVIVDTMTREEIIELLRRDHPFIMQKLEGSDKPYRKVIKNLPSRSEHYFLKPLEFKTPCGFNFVIQYFKRSKNDKKDDPLGLIPYFRYLTNKGMNVIMISLLQKSCYHFSFFEPHFFHRYRQRKLKDNTIQTKDVINTFFRRNYNFGASGCPSKKYPKGYWMFCKDGLCLCNRLEGLTILVKTFVSWEMTRIDQQEDIYYGVERTKEIGWNTDFESLLPDEIFDEYTNEGEV